MSKKGKKLGEHFFGGAASEAGVPRNTPDGDVSELVRKQVDDIWRRLDTGEIDLSYACTHVTYNEYKPVYDADALIALLLNYGYRIDSAPAFIDQFMKSDAKPIVIMSEQKASIYTDVNPLKDVPGKD